MQVFLRRSALIAAFSLALVAPRVQAQETGPADAPVTIVEYADFTSEASARAAFLVKELVDQHFHVRVVFKHLPPSPSVNANALRVHEAALAAGTQGKFWEMSDLIFANQPHQSREELIGMARQLALDVARFTADLDSGASGEFEAVISGDQTEARALGIKAPACVVNGETLAWPVTLDDLKAHAAKWLPPATR